MMTLEKLENLSRINQLKKEPPDQNEMDGMVNSAKRRLKNSQIESLSEDSRFALAYGAAHALALAAMRWHGYRSDNRTKDFYHQSLVDDRRLRLYLNSRNHVVN